MARVTASGAASPRPSPALAHACSAVTVGRRARRDGGGRGRDGGDRSADRAAAAAWIAGVEAACGGAIDVLVNNAGGVAGQEARPIELVPDADWDRIFAINLSVPPLS